MDKPISVPSSPRKTNVQKVERKELLELYESVDVDQAGFVSKRELKPVIRAKQQESGDEEIGRLIVLIDEYPKSLVEKYDFRDLLLKWDKDNIEARAAEKEAHDQDERMANNHAKRRY